MNLFDKFAEKSDTIKKLVEAIEASTRLLKEVSELCSAISKRMTDQQEEINQLYAILDTLYKQNDFDQQVEEIHQTVKKETMN